MAIFLNKTTNKDGRAEPLSNTAERYRMSKKENMSLGQQ